MSLFHPRAPGADDRPDRPVTKLTVRLPRSVPSATVVSVNGHYGDAVRKGTPVMTVRVGPDLRVVDAPRDGRLLPLSGEGDELRAGDALFALHFETPAEPPPARPLALPVPPQAERTRGALLPTDPRYEGEEVPGIATPAEPRRLASALIRVGLAAIMVAAGALFLIPLVTELGFGATLEARLALALAGIGLGALLWRLLGRGRGPVAAAGVGIAAAIWAALVVLTLTGTNPARHMVALPDSHRLAPAARTRVSPPVPVAALSPLASSIDAPGLIPSPSFRSPDAAIRFSSLPVEVFALAPVPQGPAPVIAARIKTVMAALEPAVAPTAESARLSVPRLAAATQVPSVPGTARPLGDALLAASRGAPPAPSTAQAPSALTAPTADEAPATAVGSAPPAGAPVLAALLVPPVQARPAIPPEQEPPPVLNRFPPPQRERRIPEAPVEPSDTPYRRTLPSPTAMPRPLP